VNRRTAKGSTALLMAATTTVGLSPLHLRVARPDFPAVVRALVHAGADVNLPGTNHLTHQQIAAALPLPSVILKPFSHAKNKHTVCGARAGARRGRRQPARCEPPHPPADSGCFTLTQCDTQAPFPCEEQAHRVMVNGDHGIKRPSRE
jgi:hypothetical protein